MIREFPILLLRICLDVTQLIYKSALINVSGSGKTRVCLEGLCRSWGYYMSCLPGFTLSQPFGGELLNKVLHDFKDEKGIETKNRSEYINLSVWEGRSGESNNGNFKIHTTEGIQKKFNKVIESYHIIFSWFLHAVKIVTRRKPRKKTDDYMKHWLLLNVYPKILVEDVFVLVYNKLNDGEFKPQNVLVKITDILNRDRLGLFLVFDEIQATLNTSEFKYLFENTPIGDDRKSLRPVLYPLLHALMTGNNDIRYILTGTGFDASSFDESTASMAVKIPRVANMKKDVPFYFYDKKGLEMYLARYIPMNILLANNRILIDRIYIWLRTR